MKKLYIFNLIALLVILSMSQKSMAAEAPYLAPIPTQTATVGALFTLDIDALYADPAPTYELLEARPGMTINSTSGLISWTPAQNSDGGVVTVRAFNSQGESVRTFLIYLTDAIICADDLISYWNLDETTGSTYEDFKGGYTATSLTPLTDTEGMVDRGKIFEPLGVTDQFVYVDDEGQYDFPRSGGFSMSLWFRYAGQHTESPRNQVLIARGSPSSAYDEMCMILMVNVESNPSNPRVAFSLRPKSTEELKTIMPNITIGTNQWYHVVAVYEGSPDPSGTTYMKLYINNQKGSYPHVFGGYNFTGDGVFDLNIGFWDKYPTNRYPFNGAMDEILIYDRALTDGEVAAIYNDGLAGQAHCRAGDYFPLITSTPVTTAVQDVEYSYTFSAEDYYGEEIILSAVTIPDWLTFDPATGLLNGTPGNDDVGDHTIKLKATDGSTEIFQEFTLTVENVNDPPVFTSTPKTTAKENTAYSYLVQANDPDDDDVTLTAEIIPGWLTFDEETGILVGIPGVDDVGDNPVKIVATDGELDAEQEFIIVVAPDNNLPVITSTPPNSVDNYSTYYYQITAYDIDAGDVLTYSAETIPSWLSFTPATQTLTGIPEKQDVGDHSVVLVVSDGYGEARQEFTINVRDVNTAPRVISEPNDTARVDLLYTYLVEAIDNEGEALFYSGTLIPDWMTFDTNSKVLSGTPSAEDKGDHTVIITITDGTFTVNHQFKITVVSRWPEGIGQNVDLVSKVYPNPSHDYVNFEFAGEVSLIEITDLSGKVLIRKAIEMGTSSVQLDITELSGGMYMFRVVDQDQHQTGKLIIN